MFTIDLSHLYSYLTEIQKDMFQNILTKKGCKWLATQKNPPLQSCLLLVQK